MGLAQPKKKLKLSHDPNNTKWSKDTTSIGHKLMTAQGWAPGQYLGVQDSPHSEFHTSANASHIRVILKDDTLGLGAKKGSGVAQGECVGLDGFKLLLGRLNGEDTDAIEREQKSKEDLRRAIYAERRWGTIRFVKGGLLVGDKIQKLIEDEEERVKALKGEKVSGSEQLNQAGEVEVEVDVVGETSRPSKKRRKITTEDDLTTTTSDVYLDAKAMKKRKKTKRKADERVPTMAEAPIPTKRKRDETAAERAVRKQAKKDRKRAEKAAANGVGQIQLPTASPVSSAISTPQPGTPNAMLGGRHGVRSRNIMAKRMASMDAAALNQIFMIKS